MTRPDRTRRADAYALDTEGVERVPGEPPTAFRIWRAGQNDTDHGPVYFTPDSAQLILAAQAARGNLYPFDVDHLSMKPTAPPEARKAVGWHRLEVRAGELWAVDCQWCEAMAAGLSTSPPEWRYYSPVYDTDPSGQIVRYINTAITNNPQTWNATTLADAENKDPPMRFREALDALKKMSEGDTADAKLAKAALDAMPPGMKGGDEPASSDKPGAKSSQPSGAPSSKADSEAASSGPESDAEPSTKPSGKADKRDAAKRDAAPAPAAAAAAPAAQADAVTVQLAAQVRDLEARLAARDAADEKAARAKMYKDAGASPELIRTLDSVDFKQAKAILGAMPKPKQAPASALFDAAGKAARGSLHADGTPTRYSDAAERLDARMGLRSTKLGTKRDGNTLILGVPVPAEGSK